MVVIRGNNLHPSTIQTIIHRFPDVVEYRVEIDQTDTLPVLRIEVEPAPNADGVGLANRVDRTIRDELLFKAEVRAVPPGTLPRFDLKARRWVRKT
jgi:phenylacetate-CoA ligase